MFRKVRDKHKANNAQPYIQPIPPDPTMFLVSPRSSQPSSLPSYRDSGDYQELLTENRSRGPYLEGNLKLMETIFFLDENKDHMEPCKQYHRLTLSDRCHSRITAYSVSADGPGPTKDLMTYPFDIKCDVRVPRGTASTAGPSFVCQVPSSNAATPTECPCEVMCCQFNADGSIVAVGLTDGCIKMYSTYGGALLHSLSDSDTLRDNLPVTQLKFRHWREGDSEEYSKILLAAYTSGHVKYWHYPSSSCLFTLNEDRQILTMNHNDSGTRLITAGSDAKVHVYDQASRIPLTVCEQSDHRDAMDGHVFRVFAAQYHPNIPHAFITGGWDNTVQYWDDRVKQSVRKLHGPHICGDALDIDPVHNHILTGSWRKRSVLQIWDFASGKLIKDVPQEPLSESQLYCAKWLGKDSIVCGGSDQNMARLIDRGTLNTVGQLVDLPQGVYCIDIDYSASKPRLAVGSNRFIFILRADKNPSV